MFLEVCSVLPLLPSGSLELGFCSQAASSIQPYDLGNFSSKQRNDCLQGLRSGLGPRKLLRPLVISLRDETG